MYLTSSLLIYSLLYLLECFFLEINLFYTSLNQSLLTNYLIYSFHYLFIYLFLSILLVSLLTNIFFTYFFALSFINLFLSIFLYFNVFTSIPSFGYLIHSLLIYSYLYFLISIFFLYVLLFCISLYHSLLIYTLLYFFDSIFFL